MAAASYSAVVSGDTPNAWWRLGDAPGSTLAAEQTGQGDALDFVGSTAPTFGVSGALSSEADTAANFGGASTGSSFNFDTVGNFAAEIWFRVTSPVSSTASLIGGDNGQQPTWQVLLRPGGSIQALATADANSGTTFETDSASSGYDNGFWHHLVIDYSGSTTSIFVDGVQVGASTITIRHSSVVGVVQNGSSVCQGTHCVFYPAHTKIGSLGGSTAGFTGDVDEFAVYESRLLTAAQVNAHYQAGIAPPDLSNEPSLTSDQTSQAISLATSDPRLGLILGGAQYTVGPVATWSELGGAKIIGGVVRLDLTTPAMLTADWPMYVYNNSENTDPVYQTMVVHFTNPVVSSVNVSVDLNCSTVVSILPTNETGGDSTDSVVSGPTQPPACGDPTSNKAWVHNVRLISVGNSAFYNYEFYSPDTSRPDGPIDVIVWGDSALSKNSANIYSLFGSSAYGYASDSIANFPPSSSSSWDSAGGERDRGTCHEDTHYRLWGNSGGFPLANSYWGYFLIGQVHHDRGDFIPGYNCGEKWFGAFEDAEGKLASDWIGTFGASSVSSDAVPTLNAEGQSYPAKGYWDGDHWRSNDGLATKLRVCLDNVGNHRTCP